MRKVLLHHIHDLSALRRYIWSGDIGWAACKADLSSSLGPYLRGLSTPRDKQWQLAWRLLLAKTQNNQAFEAEWQQGGHEMPSVEALPETCRVLHLCDKAPLGHFLGVSPQQIRPLACPQQRKRLFRKSRAIAAAVVLRAKYNKLLEPQIAPWLNPKDNAVQA